MPDVGKIVRNITRGCISRKELSAKDQKRVDKHFHDLGLCRGTIDSFNERYLSSFNPQVMFYVKDKNGKLHAFFGLRELFHWQKFELGVTEVVVHYGAGPSPEPDVNVAYYVSFSED